MAWTDALLSLFSTSVTLNTLSGFSTDGYGVPSYSTGGTSIPVRIVAEQSMVRTFEGIEELATTTCWLASTSTFGPADQFTLPDGTTPPVLAVERFSDEDGWTHSKVYFG